MASTRTGSPGRARARSSRPGKLLNDWETVSREAELGSLAELAGGLWERLGLRPGSGSAGELTPAQERELMLKALADAQACAARRSGGRR